MAETKTFHNLDSLAELSKLAGGMNLQPPKLRKLPEFDAGDLEKMVAEKLEACDHIQEDTANALKYLASIRGLLERQTNRTARKIVESETKEDVAEMQEYLNEVLSVEDPIYLQSAVIAYIRSVLSQEFTDHDQAYAALHDLGERGILVKTGPDGPIMIGYQHFDVNGNFGFEPEDIAEINKTAAKFSRCLKALEYQKRQEKETEAKGMADINLSEAMDGANGKCLMEIPPESYEKPDGTEAWRGGGKMLVSFTDEEIFPITGVGSIERSVETMASLDISLSRHELSQDVPPGIGKTFSSVQKTIMSKMGMGWEDAGAFLKKKQAYWHLFHRSILALRGKEAMAKLQEELQSKADITGEQFFRLNGSETTQHGTACLCFEGAFQQKDRRESLYNLFFLAKRGVDGDKETVEIVEVPSHLEETLGEFVGKKFPTEDNFSYCPGQLRRMLRGIYGQLDMAREIAKS